MGWFDEQIRKRIENDDELVADAFARMAKVVGSGHFQQMFDSDRKSTTQAIGDILRYYHIKPQEIPDNIHEFDDILEFLMRPSGVMRRGVKLTKGWQKNAAGAMLGETTEGDVVALIPGPVHGYTYKNPKTGETVTVSAKNAHDLKEDAICFYSPLPLRALGTWDLLKYLLGLLRPRDIILIAGATLLTSLIGLVTPVLNQKLFGDVLALGSEQLLCAFLITLILFGAAQVLIQVCSAVVRGAVRTRLEISAESVIIMRLLALPVDFFKKYSSGDLAQRANAATMLCGILFETIFSSLLTAAFSIIYIGQIAVLAPALAAPALIIIALTLAVSAASALLRSRLNEKQLLAGSRESGVVFALLNGIAKLKVSGAEKRAFAKWAEYYEKSAQYQYNPPAFLKMDTAILAAVSLFGTIVLYDQAIRAQIAPADYMAFTSAYALVSGAFSALSGVVVQLSLLHPILKMIEPILKAKPEVAPGKNVIDRLSGSIEVNNVSFRYKENMPNVLDNLSLKIRSGQYVAIVGSTGCGKSTLMRILLGFERPQKGAVYYDGRDLNSVDLKSLRRHIGVVMQNGKLFQGDLFSNITISAPQATLEDAWEAAEMAGMAEDIRNMPMQMNTMVSEGGGGISGGQRQRLMIARAIASKPRILMFDEATSALDNITQKTVSESLDRLKCTRIVIAHRLSTIRHCDRIIVLDKGRIAEDGTYEELIAKNGVFAELVERQRVDV